MKEATKLPKKRQNRLTAENLAQLFNRSVELLNAILYCLFENKKTFFANGKYHPLVLKIRNRKNAYFVLNNKEEALEAITKLYHFNYAKQIEEASSSKQCIPPKTDNILQPNADEEKITLFPKENKNSNFEQVGINMQKTSTNNILKKPHLSIPDLKAVFMINKSSFETLLQEFYEKKIMFTDKNGEKHSLVKKTPEDSASQFYLNNSKNACILFSELLAQKGIMLERTGTAFQIKKILKSAPFPTKKMLSQMVSIYLKEN